MEHNGNLKNGIMETVGKWKTWIIEKHNNGKNWKTGETWEIEKWNNAFF